MPDDLDLRDVHGRHEPDPTFRLELRRQVAAIVRASAATTITTDHDDQEELLMLTDSRTEPPATASRARRWLLPAAAAVIVAVVAAVALTAGDDGEEESTTASSSVVFHDDFSGDDSRWDLLPGITIGGGEQVWRISTAGQVEFTRPDLSEERLVDMEVTAVVASTDPDSTLGVYCRKGVANQDFYYYFRLAPAGAVIGVLPPDSGTPAVILAEDTARVRPGAPFELTARCVDEAGVAQLTMLVDGEVVLEATHDAPLPAGYGALEVQAGAPGSADSEVHWDEFTVSSR